MSILWRPCVNIVYWAPHLGYLLYSNWRAKYSNNGISTTWIMREPLITQEFAQVLWWKFITLAQVWFQNKRSKERRMKQLSNGMGMRFFGGGALGNQLVHHFILLLSVRAVWRLWLRRGTWLPATPCRLLSSRSHGLSWSSPRLSESSWTSRSSWSSWSSSSAWASLILIPLGSSPTS